MDQPLVANHENTKVIGTKEQEGLFEPRIEPCEEGQVGEVLTVGIDRHPPSARTLVQGGAAGLVLGLGNCREFLGYAEVG